MATGDSPAESAVPSDRATSRADHRRPRNFPGRAYRIPPPHGRGWAPVLRAANAPGSRKMTRNVSQPLPTGGPMLPFVSSLDELESCAPRHVLLLYSGGVDGTYLLQWLARRNIEVSALQVRFGDAGEVDSDVAKWRAAKFGVSLHAVDASREFFTDFLPAAIHADAYYQGQFPVGSTLTRPLMAKVAVDAARQLGCDAVAHTATYTQNSSLRLSGSIAAL